MAVDIAHALVNSGGSGDRSDAALLIPRISLLSYPILVKLWQNGTRIVACRNSITDYLTQLRGQQPRGWPAGYTWDTVPGIFYPSTNEVVIAILGHETGQPHLPAMGEGEGSADVVIHETAHGLDMGAGQPYISASPAFMAARQADLAALPAYECQPGIAGPEETFAESCAMFHAGKDQATPNLHVYWEKFTP